MYEHSKIFVFIVFFSSSSLLRIIFVFSLVLILRCVKQRIVKSKFDFPKVEQQSSLKRLCYMKKEQGKAQEEKEGTENRGLGWGC